MSERSNIKTGVYRIRNLINEKCYIGSSSYSINKRWILHRDMLKKNSHHSIILQRAWNKYGIANFKFEILEECASEKCIEREQYYINTLKPEYNIDPTAGSPRGRKYSEEYKNKIRNRTIGNKNPFYGKRHTEDTKKIISKKLKGKIAGKFIGNKNPMYMKTHSNENKQIMSNASNEFWNSDEGMALRMSKSIKMTGVSNKNALKGEFHPNYNPTIYKWANDFTNEVFIGTLYHFRKKYNICSDVCYLLNGKYKQYKGWRVIKDEK
jgi:group I intron endonuclease